MNTADLPALIRSLPPLSAVPALAKLAQDALLLLASRPRTVDELRRQLVLVTQGNTIDLLVGLERLGLVERIPAHTSGRASKGDRVYGLAPTFLEAVARIQAADTAAQRCTLLSPSPSPDPRRSP